MSETYASETSPSQDSTLPGFDRAAGARILARSFYKELRASGYTPRQLLSVSTELIDLITQDLQSERKGTA